ncbi:VOC family protein [Rhizobium leguminosarum]|uniref:VOC family protein n=1 Tax=Rhizobium leguminosarum TaxID=384 RepID=A0A6P0B355_RHILE|nr:VOC family protein [Rhizobium leguminosarum]MBY5436986.1 VOC family protein [Rhizobium leguminosarum]NEI33646.1 VOC family protein [Rhizobium leguminosarum]NEI41295.1 VOC family protein [Rhizobium leguminosarum]
MEVRVVRLGHVGLTVRDIDRTIDFYSTYLGMRLTEKFEYPEEKIGHGVAVAAGAFLRCDVTHHEMSIFRMRRDILAADAPDAPRYGFGLHHIAFELNTPEDLKGLFKKMRDGGVEIVNSRKGGPGNQPRFYARDPDGNLLEFYWGIDKIGWEGASRTYDPIEEIDLLNFDFEAYVDRRERDAAEARKGIRSGLNT